MDLSGDQSLMRPILGIPLRQIIIASCFFVRWRRCLVMKAPLRITVRLKSHDARLDLFFLSVARSFRFVSRRWK